MTTEYDAPGARVHPVLACAGAIAQALKDTAAVPVDFMTTPDRATALIELARLADQLAALRMRILAAADDVALDAGARDAAAWLTHETLGDRRADQRDLALAESLDRRWTRLGAALAEGRVNLAQSRVVAHALDELPAGLAPSVTVEAEEHLIDLAADFGPPELRVLGRRILDVVAPEVGETAEAKALEAEERRAADALSLTLKPQGDGTTRLHGRLPDAVAHRLTTYLDAFTSPRRLGAAAPTTEVEHPDARGPLSHRRGAAFCALLEHLDPSRLPHHGGDATTVVVTMTLEQLCTDLATAGVISHDDQRITAGEARRLACTARVVPAVLGRRSEVLDLGRASRLFSPAQRKALRLRDRRCRAVGCTIPATWCEAHHLRPWSLCGTTDLDDGVLLCSFHHHRAHDPTYELSRHPGGELAFHRRP